MDILRNALPQDIARCIELESTAYSGNEAASPERVERRIVDYSQGFLLLERDGEVVGFVNSACTSEVNLADEALKDLADHDADAPHVVILSVVVDPALQGEGLARLMLNAFVGRMVEMGKESIHLMCEDSLVPLYEKFGFRFTRPSASRHGGKAWQEMALTL